MSRLLKNFIELKNNYLLLIAFLAIMIFSQFTLQYREALWPKLYMLIGLVAGLLTLLFSRLNDPKKIARNAFVLILFLGIANSLILPVRQNLDENTHYYQALQISDGKLRNQVTEKNFLMISPDFLAITKLPSKPGYGSKINTNLYHKDFLELKNKPSDYKHKYMEDGGFNNPSYIPSALGIKIGQIISKKLFVSYYMGRIFNLIFYALLVYLAIKISKRYKIQLFVISTLPYTLWIAAGYNYDSSYYGLILLILAQFANFIGEEPSITIKRMIYYSFTCFLLVFCKAPMILLAILPLLLPKRFFVNVKTYICSFFIVAVSGFLGLIWIGQKFILTNLGFMTQKVLLTESPKSETVSRMSYFMEHPTYTIEMVLRSISDIPATIMGSVQNPQPYLMPSEALSFVNLLVFFFLFIIISLLVKNTLPAYVYFRIGSVFIIITFAVFYAISGDSRVFSIGDLKVSGIQGRYHFYLLAFLPMFLAPKLRQVLKLSSEAQMDIDEDRFILLIFKIIFLTTWINTCVALFGYL